MDTYQREQARIEQEMSDRERAAHRSLVRSELASLLVLEGKTQNQVVDIFRAIRAAANVFESSDTERAAMEDHFVQKTLERHAGSRRVDGS